MKQKLLLLAFLLVFFGTVNAQTTNGLLYNFKFDANLNDSLNNSVAFSTSGATFAPDRFKASNKALNVLNSTSVTLPNIPLGKNPRTISVWFYFSALNTSEQHILSYGSATTNRAFGLSVQPFYNTLKFYGWAADITTTYVFSDKTWYNVVLTYDGLNATVVINGVKVVTQSVPTWDTSGNVLRLGESVNGSRTSNIYFDDLRIYNRTLTDSEINVLSAYPFNEATLRQNILSYYSFDTNFSNQSNQLTWNNNGSVALTAGKYGNAATFSGSNGLSSSEYSTLLESNVATSFTFSFWKKDLNGNNAYQTLFELFGNYFLRFRTTGIMEGGYQFANSSTWATVQSGTSVIAHTQWQHICLIHDVALGTDVIYINGIPVMYYKNWAYMIAKPFSTITLGSGLNSGGAFDNVKYYKGQIDELYIFNKAITAAEVTQLMNLSSSFMATGINNPNLKNIRVYPNPCTDIVCFQDDENTKKQIWDLAGTMLIETTEKTLNIKNLSTGVYVVKFIDHEKLIGTSILIKR